MNDELVAKVEASTDVVPPAQRIKYWEAHNASELIGLRCSSYASQGLQARESNFDLGSLRLAEIRGNEHVVERTASLLRRHPKDSIFACLLLKGDAFFYQAGRCVPVHQGDLILYTTSLPYLYGFTREMWQVQVDIDAGRLLERGRLWRPVAPIKIDGGLRSGRFLNDALRTTMRDFIDHPLAADAEAVAAKLQRLLETILSVHSPDPTRNESAVIRLLKAEAFIAEHLGEPELDAKAVARHLAISVRHLNRVFEHHRCTVTQWIWRQRLERARASLCNPAERQLAVGEIAMRHGFSTPSHFASSFKAEYGVTPSQQRRSAGAL
ncbi:MAG TPA: helix-turn-helix domain-containing protein [Caldimonas sp.]|nr:helix-turn-helix domain-containing protein [Caldimonas sp.]HEX4233115.1 helix-turn-helix domain-containing protein [Caldimonas sp.]